MATEQRLIDANGSYTLNATDNTGHSLCFGGGIISVMDNRGACICEFFAEDAPTVDAVEVVRCQDCEHWKEPWLEGVTSGKCMLGKTMITEPDHFCSYGERRTDEKV